jgi:hypothetical protein
MAAIKHTAKTRYTSATAKPRGSRTLWTTLTSGLSRSAISSATRNRKTT